MPAPVVEPCAPRLPGPISARTAAAIVSALACACQPQPAPASVAEPRDRFGQPHATPASSEPAPEPPFDRPAMVRFHMQRQFDDLRTIERRLIHGKLDEAQALAHLLSRPAPEPGLAPYQAEYRRVTDAALALASAGTLAQACRREPRISAACANCHLRTEQPGFGPPPSLPPDLPTREARMARHLWATDRLWEAMVGPSEAAWRGGLTVLAGTPLPFTPTGTAELARRLQDIAEDQLSRAASLDERAAAYGELLVTCAGCHTTLTSAAR